MNSKYSPLPFKWPGSKTSSNHWIFCLILFLSITDQLLSNQECLQLTLSNDAVLSCDIMADDHHKIFSQVHLWPFLLHVLFVPANDKSMLLGSRTHSDGTMSPFFFVMEGGKKKKLGCTNKPEMKNCRLKCCRQNATHPKAISSRDHFTKHMLLGRNKYWCLSWQIYRQFQFRCCVCTHQILCQVPFPRKCLAEYKSYLGFESWWKWTSLNLEAPARIVKSLCVWRSLLFHE